MVLSLTIIDRAISGRRVLVEPCQQTAGMCKVSKIEFEVKKYQNYPLVNQTTFPTPGVNRS